MSDFDVFSNRWEITGKITLVTPLRIGGGQNAGAYSLSQSPVLISYDAHTQTAQPYIPGSSLKGVLRSTMERIIRTLNEKKSCIAVGERRAVNNVLCGKSDCVPCSIFGSQKSGASIRVQDAHLCDDVEFGNVLDERPHCATLYDKRSDRYEMQMVRRGNFKVPKTILRMEEVVATNTSFDLNINIDNVNDRDIGLLMLMLEEFNHKRCHLGGGVSRGHGFADIGDLKVIKKTIDSDNKLFFNVLEEQCDIDKLRNYAKDYLRSIDDGNEINRRDFDIYYRAYQTKGMSGHLVVKYKITTLKPFQMPGVDESTVTNYGVPVIPGSTIKGFLRHKLIKDGVVASIIDEIFGSVKGNYQHRSRLLVSDAYPDENFAGRDMIPENTTLTMWVVFDNMEANEVNLIKNVLTSRQVITGKRIAGVRKGKPADNNEVEFSAVTPERFNISKYLKES
ncbi:MAG: RAMP superfamily CRISPR-associated protein [ANME-2 cluster archaeon]|nr:RAMP superfamily CRISPR-associated protein [ANME-2 cluster archaeon]